VLARAELETLRDGWLVRGRWSKADLWTATLPGGRRVVVKDFAGKPWLGRALGRFQLRREQRALAALAGLPGVPALVGVLDADGFAMERVEGTRLPKCSPEARRRALPEFARILAAAHAAGVVHNDLRGRENVLVAADGLSVAVIDWGGATFFPPGSWRRRLFFPWARRVDEGGFLKWKEQFAPEALTGPERDFLRRFRRWRRLWPFNRKGA
jgi:aminoglycoside phosphotransferase (APT) family kinase protein